MQRPDKSRLLLNISFASKVRSSFHQPSGQDTCLLRQRGLRWVTRSFSVPRCHSSQCRHDSPTAPAGSTQQEVRPGGITLGNSGACLCSTAMKQSVPPRGLSKVSQVGSVGWMEGPGSHRRSWTAARSSSFARLDCSLHNVYPSPRKPRSRDERCSNRPLWARQWPPQNGSRSGETGSPKSSLPVLQCRSQGG